MMHGHGHRRILDTSVTPVSSIKLRGIRLNIPDDRERGSASLIRRPRLSRREVAAGPVVIAVLPSFFSHFFPPFRPPPFSYDRPVRRVLDVPKTGFSA